MRKIKNKMIMKMKVYQKKNLKNYNSYRIKINNLKNKIIQIIQLIIQNKI